MSDDKMRSATSAVKLEPGKAHPEAKKAAAAILRAMEMMFMAAYERKLKIDQELSRRILAPEFSNRYLSYLVKRVRVRHAAMAYHASAEAVRALINGDVHRKGGEVGMILQHERSADNDPDADRLDIKDSPEWDNPGAIDWSPDHPLEPVYDAEDKRPASESKVSGDSGRGKSVVNDDPAGDNAELPPVHEHGGDDGDLVRPSEGGRAITGIADVESGPEPPAPPRPDPEPDPKPEPEPIVRTPPPEADPGWRREALAPTQDLPDEPAMPSPVRSAIPPPTEPVVDAQGNPGASPYLGEPYTMVGRDGVYRCRNCDSDKVLLGPEHHYIDCTVRTEIADI